MSAATPNGVETTLRTLARELGQNRTHYTKQITDGNEAIRVAKAATKDVLTETTKVDQILAIFKDTDDEEVTLEKLKSIMEAHRKVEEFGGIDVLTRAIEATPRLQSIRRCKEKTELNRKYRELLKDSDLKGYNVYMVTWTDLLDWRTKAVLPTSHSFVMMMPDVEHPDDNEDSVPGLLHARLALIDDGEVNEMYFPPGKYDLAHVDKVNCFDLCEVVFAQANMGILAQADGLVGGGTMTPSDYVKAMKRDSLRMIKSHVRDTYAVLAPFEKTDDADRRCRGKRRDYSNGGFGGGYRTMKKRQRGEGSSSSTGAQEEEEEVEVEVDEEEDDVDHEDQVVATLVGTPVQNGGMQRVDSMVGDPQADALNTLANQAAAAPSSAPEPEKELDIKPEPGTSA